MINKAKETAIDLNAIQDLINKQKESAKQSKNKVCLGIEGDAKTGKSGLVMDSTFKTFYLDCDIGAVPTWKTNYNSTERIVIFNPAAEDEEGNFLPYQTQGNIRSFIALVRQEIEKGEEIVFVWDGVDSWLDYCTMYMTGMENARMRPMKAKSQQDWFQRNQPFREVLKESLSLDCHRLYITHTKPPFRDEAPAPIWNRWDSHLHSIVKTNQRITAKGTEYHAEVKSSKYHPELVGKRFNFLTINRDGSVQWEGISHLKEMNI